MQSNAVLERVETRTPVTINRAAVKRIIIRNRLWKQIGYIPHAKQQVVHNAIVQGAKRIICIWGRRSGKSIMAASEFLTEMAYKSDNMLPQRLIRIVAPESDITEKIFNYLYLWIVQQRIFGCEPKSKSSHQHYIEMPWGARLEGLTTKLPESLLGDGVVAIGSDEHAQNADGNMLIHKYIVPTLLDTQGFAFLLTTSEGRHNHAEYTFQEWQERRAAGDLKYFASRISSYENTSVGNYAEFCAELDATRESCARLGLLPLFDQLYNSIPSAMSGAIYPEFNREKHVRSDMQPIPGIPLTLGIDWGFKNPFVCLFGQVLNDGERFHIIDEIYQSGLTDLDAADLTNARCDYYGLKVDMAYADPSSPEAISTFETQGIPMWCGSSRGNQRLNSVVDGILQVRGAIASDNLIYSSKCQNTIRDMESYKYSEKAESEKPIKDSDHGCDATRYMVRGSKLAGGQVGALWA